MDCETATSGNFFVVRWHVASPLACAQVIREVKALREREKKPIAYLGIMPEDMARIDEPGRKALMDLTTALGAHTDIAAVAMEARGFAGAAMRSILAGVMLVSGLRAKIKFVDTVGAAMHALRAVPLPANDAMRTAIERVGGHWDPSAAA